jgi:hypothetical protein
MIDAETALIVLGVLVTLGALRSLWPPRRW